MSSTTLTRDQIQVGTRVLGLAPIGIRWEGVMQKDNRIKPDGNCPRAEFCLTHVWSDGRWVEVK